MNPSDFIFSKGTGNISRIRQNFKGLDAYQTSLEGGGGGVANKKWNVPPSLVVDSPPYWLCVINFCNFGNKFGIVLTQNQWWSVSGILELHVMHKVID